MLLIIISVFFLLIALVLFGISQNFKYFTKQGIPGPKPKFFYGHTKESILGKKNGIYEIDEVYRYARGKYLFTGFFKFFKPYFLIIDPALVKKILITDFNIFKNNGFSKLINKRRDPILGLHPFFTSDDGWKEKRADVMSAITQNKLTSMYPLAIESANKLVNHVDEKLTKPYDVCDLAFRYTCDMISSSIFNIDAHSFTADNPEILENSIKVMNGIFKSFSTLYPHKVFSKESTVYFKRLMIDSIRRSNEISCKREDILTHIVEIQQNKGLTEEEMLAMLWTFFMESFATSGTALQFMLYELSKDQRVQDKLRKEIAVNLDEAENRMTFETMMELEYLDQVFHESIRLHPPLMYTTRVCSENYEIDGAKGQKYLMRKGDEALISIYSIHHDPDHFPHPESFEPERFDSVHGGVKSFIDRCLLLPFGVGERNCAGIKLGNLIVKTAIVEILKNFRVVINENVPDKMEIGKNELFYAVSEKVLVNFQRL